MIDARAILKRRGAQEVLRGVDFALEAGGVAVIIGPSGGGKSTFLRTLNGLEPYHAGTLTVAGVSLPPEVDARRDATILRDLRRRVGFVFQQFHLFPHLSVRENLALAPRTVLGLSRDEAYARAERLLDRVGLADKIDRMPRELSGGQEQRVAIARTLAMEPSLVLFDEPTSALDPQMAHEVSAVIRELAEDGQSMVVVTHAMALARKIARTAFVFAEGRCVESGVASRVLEAPEHPVTRALLDRG